MASNGSHVLSLVRKLIHLTKTLRNSLIEFHLSPSMACTLYSFSSLLFLVFLLHYPHFLPSELGQESSFLFCSSLLVVVVKVLVWCIYNKM